MKTISIAMVIMIALIVQVMALPTEVEVRTLSPIEAFMESLTPQSSTPFYITGGTFSNTGDVVKGEQIDVKVNVKFEHDAIIPNAAGQTYKLELYFVDETKLIAGVSDDQLEKVNIGTYFFKTPRKAGEWIEITIRNVDTSILGSSYCSKGIKFVGHHYYFDGKSFVLDTPGETLVSRKSLANFRLDCPENNPCGTSTIDLGYVCLYGTERWMKQQDPYLQADGTCLISYEKRSCNPGYVCESGKCVEKVVCSSGEMRCSFNGITVEKCVNNAWEAAMIVCEQGCSQGICNEDKIAAKEPECSGTDGKECLDDGGEPEAEAECAQPCTTDYKCSNGDVLLQCSNGCYTKTSLEKCPATETASAGTTASTGTATGTTATGTTAVATGTDSAFKVWFSKNQWVYGVIAFVAVGGYLLLGRKKK